MSLVHLLIGELADSVESIAADNIAEPEFRGTFRLIKKGRDIMTEHLLLIVIVGELAGNY